MLSLVPLRKKRGSTSAPRTTLRTASLKSAGRFWTINGALSRQAARPFCSNPSTRSLPPKSLAGLGIPHIPYTLLWDDGIPYSVCEDFVTPNTELIPAWRVMQTQKKDNQTSVYQHYRNCCEKLGVPNVTHALNQMLVLDYLIANEDRHFNNFGCSVTRIPWNGWGLPPFMTAAPPWLRQADAANPFRTKYHLQALQKNPPRPAAAGDLF